MKTGVVVVLLTTSVALAQTPYWQPEIRRAEPVTTPTPTPTPKPEPPTAPAVPFDNPSWMERVSPTPTPPPPASPAAPAPSPELTPYRPQGRVEVSPTPGEAGEIRLSPTQSTGTNEASLLDSANGFYSRKMYDYAIPEYEKFLVAFPSAPARDMAMFRLAEAHRFLGNTAAARAAYERLVAEVRTGEFSGSGAYRLGEMLYADKLYDAALIQFQNASKNARNEDVRLAANYNVARCLERLKKTDAAIAAFRLIVSKEKDNPYRDVARLSLAGLLAGSGKKKEALAQFEALASSAEKPAVRAEAMVKAAALASETGDPARAAELFSEAAEMPEIGEWKAASVLGAMKADYERGEMKKVIATPESTLKSLPGDALPEALLLMANAQRQLGNHTAAREAYDRLMRQFPNSNPSANARFHRLVSLYQLNDPNLLKEIDDFLLLTSNPRERSQAQLLKAEALYTAGKFAEAAQLYRMALSADLPANLKQEALFKLSWSLAQSDDFKGAILAYSDYMKKYPDSPKAASALAQRGLAKQSLKDYPGALSDFEKVIDDHPKSPDRELALQQKALILGQQQDYAAMKRAFEALLEEYPESAAAGQANFWIGWAAFEAKDYNAAIPRLEKAKQVDPNQYFERAALRILLSYFYLEDRAAVEKTIATNKGLVVPGEIYVWLAGKSFESGDYTATVASLEALVKSGAPVPPEAWIQLAESKIRLGKFKEAAEPAAKFLDAARDPSARARALIAQARIALHGRDFDGATRLADEALLLQPEGRLNADARMLTGEISYAKSDFDAAARAFMTVAVLYDDKVITPLALSRAAEAYRRANNPFEAEKALNELRQKYPDYEKSPKVSRTNDSSP